MLKHAIPVTLVLLAAMAAAQDDPQPAKARLSRLQGHVAAAPRGDVVGAAVLVRALGDETRAYLTSSGEGGAFSIDGLPDGEYRVRVARHGLSPVTKDKVNVRFPFRAVVEVSMEPGRAETARSVPATTGERIALRGRIRDEDGEPMPDARVRLVRIDGSIDPRSLRTESDGGFSFSDLQTGAWRLELRGVGFLPIRQPIDLGKDTELMVTMVRQPPQYEPSPLELMPPERPVPPEGFDGPV